MPAGYAHYRFGTQIFPRLPADVRTAVSRHRALFDVGLHGPDFLFFHSFFKKTALYRLGSAYHQKSGRDFFSAACAHVKAQASEAAASYLYGLLAHYCLDCGCQTAEVSFNNEEERIKAAEHAAMMWNIGKVISIGRGE